MAGALARHEAPPEAADAALRLLLEETRLLALNAAIEFAAAGEAGLPGVVDDEANTQGIVAAVDLLLQQIRSAASLDRPL